MTAAPAVPRRFLLWGGGEPPPRTVPLRAGPFRLDFEAGDLRRLRLGGREAVRRIYAAVRDRHWGTVPGVVSGLRIRTSRAGFVIRYAATHRAGEIHFVWRVRLTGAADGTIRCEYDGEAKSSFLRNRIGLCVLHPTPECAGARVRTRHGDGTEAARRFPRLVAAEQPVAGFTDLAALAHEVAPGVWCEAAFEGEVFETEDQRNWIDASFKTYGTPLRLPFPVAVPAGTRIRQAVTLRLLRPPRTRLSPARGDVAGAQGPIRLAFARGPGRPLPALGFGAASHGRPPGAAELARLAALRPAHLRADLRLGHEGWRDEFRRVAREAAALGAGLELALHLPPRGEGALAALAGELRRTGVPPVRFIVLREGRRSTDAAALAAARRRLGGAEAPVGAGTDADLCQLHLEPPAAGADFIAWSMNPQVHATDLASLRETPRAVPDQLRSARAHFGRRPLAVSPVMLRPRFNPVAAAGDAPPPPEALPSPVDPRQLSLAGAAWTVAMLQALAGHGLESVTWYETTGWRGLLETEAGSPHRAAFPSVPGAVFPVWHVFAAVAELAGGRVLGVENPAPLDLAVLALGRGRRRLLLLANFTPRPLAVQPPAGAWRCRRLDAENVWPALQEPGAFLAAPGKVVGAEQGGRTVTLPPFALARLDAEARA